MPAMNGHGWRRGWVFTGRFLLVAGVVCLSGCTSANQRLDTLSGPLGTRKSNHTPAAISATYHPPSQLAPAGDRRRIEPATQVMTTLPSSQDGCFVGVAISGGGSRSANFSAGILFQLDRLKLLEHVDYMSSVSGGSLTAAYYCASTTEEWNQRNLQRRLTHGFATDMLRRTLMPWNLFAMAVTDWDRSDLLADTLRKNLFTRDGRELHFGDLRADRPRLFINATDLQSGKRFVFCNESFDELNSDLAGYPLADAVAASASVPVLLHHVTLRDYSTPFKQYVHLIDGGVTDNLGVQTLAEVYQAHTEEFGSPGQGPYPRGAVFIVIDARTNANTMLSDQSDIGLLDSLQTGAGLASTALLNRASTSTLADLIVQNAQNETTAEAIRDQIQMLESTGYVQLTDQAGRPVHVVHLALSRVSQLNEVPFAGFDDRLNSIATYFNIEGTEAYHLYQAADLLVEQRFEPTLVDVRNWIENGSAATKPVIRPATGSLNRD